ncbi:kinetochore complex Sim4 subunit Fta1-domain-containing protein [Dichotomopilus funicola]|uniref:Kinetochore complex Sim4 subunit Fta1-domain-containing protein n=1 Tax=Dichotomopilus funicola TaxID=1934379 RepID=A0AAN6V0D6_9PEZI|nr:kinetochore complex Sim4 subunit Fta1-domain-containing protein [Dichotomopilus funicola]
MPPKRRQPPPRDPDSEPEPPPRENDNDPSDEEAEEGDSAFEQTPLPFYNTTFSAHRVSPLYLGAESLSPNRLQLLAQRLRDRLVGDVVRGVEIGDGGDSVVARAGALERVDISWVKVADVLRFSEQDVEGIVQRAGGDEGDESSWGKAAGELQDKKALHVALQYELVSCTAFLLPRLRGDAKMQGTDPPTRFMVGSGGDAMDWEQSVDPAHFMSLPLLLLRMPPPLKTIMADFLAAMFDCRVSPMRLGTQSLIRNWEAWVRTVSGPTRGTAIKDAVLTLGFHVQPPAVPVPTLEDDADDSVVTEQKQTLGLKSVDVIIPAAELRKFVAAGKRVASAKSDKTTSSTGWAWENDVQERRKLAGRLQEEGWEWLKSTSPPGGRESHPFTEALACYLQEHLGLNLLHPSVRVIKIACGGFAMSESRLKVFVPSDAGQRDVALEVLGRLTEKT